MLVEAKQISENPKLPKKKKAAVRSAAEKVENMLESIENNQEYDNAVIKVLKDEISDILA